MGDWGGSRPRMSERATFSSGRPAPCEQAYTLRGRLLFSCVPGQGELNVQDSALVTTPDGHAPREASS